MTTIRITRHNAGNPIHVGDIVSDSQVTEAEIDALVNVDDGHMHDLMDYAGESSTIPHDYEWTGDECYEIVAEDAK